ncbi:YnfA family protein [Campylobacter sp. MIT 99-7217]|uniref:YnfA family protein n=1 Tax=Campylobacter sp. MIT 99-7217 TaxID=535091 RepID=UPI0011570D8D|nr:YnfA family protein [Campylobacter sp. MIT 99-7217]TQR34507.1 YnfA family protein [Campylobacter sp. MIT 99-7217]
MIKSVLLFILAAFLEVGGGYLVWLCLKENKGLFVGIIGGVFLVLYAVVASFQNESFGRVFAAYGGIFIVFSIFWAMYFDGFKPDIYDILGALFSLFGVWLMMYAPRNA